MLVQVLQEVNSNIGLDLQEIYLLEELPVEDKWKAARVTRKILTATMKVGRRMW